MNWGEIRGKIEADAAHRIKEIQHAVLAIPDPRANAHAPIMRACVVLFWAHLEGFVKDSSRMLVRFLEEENLTLLRPGNILLPKGQPMNVDRLFDTVAVLGIDDSEFSISRKELIAINELRNKVAHGKYADEDALLNEERVRHMEDTVAATIRSFKEGIFKSADDHRAK